MLLEYCLNYLVIYLVIKACPILSQLYIYIYLFTKRVSNIFPII